MSTNKKREILWRAYFGFAFIFLLGVAILSRAFYIQTVQGRYYRSMADSLTIFPKTVFAERGNIYSEDGRLLATTLPTFDIRIDFKTTYQHADIFTKNLDSFSLMLSKMFPEKTAQRYRNELVVQRQKKSRYYLLKRNVSYNQLSEMKAWPLFRESQYKSGIIAVQNDKRLMPFGLLAQRTIGSTNKNGRSVGLEGSFDGVLRGKEGQVMVQKIAGGVTVPLDSKIGITPQPGKDVYTTLNVELQDVAEDALMRALEHHKAEHGCVVLMEVKTGKIKAMANLGLVKDSTYGEVFNYAVGEATEPGSTFKLATIASLMEDGLVNKNTKVEVGDGEFAVYKLKIRDHDKPENPVITVKRAVEVSSNVAVAKLAYNNYASAPDKFYKHLTEFGFTRPLDMEVVGASKPVLNKPEKWSGVSCAYIAHGYELQITPLHTLAFYNAIANNGVMVKPYLVDRIREYNNTVDTITTTVLNQKICSDKTLAELQEILRGVVDSGTATNLRTDYLHVAGKTGTAVIAQGKSGYKNSGRKVYQASFCGYFPAEDPQYSMIVIINSPSTNGYYGNVVAGAIFKEVADKVYSLNLNMHRALNVQLAANNSMPVVNQGASREIGELYAYLGSQITGLESEWASVQNENEKIVATEAYYTENLVPDVKGMTLKDVLFLLETRGFVVSVEGNGEVVSQSLKPGEKFVRGTPISLELK